jgi:hypothetical protein
VQALRAIGIALALLVVSAAPATAEDERDEDREGEDDETSEKAGEWALALLVGTIAFVPLNVVKRKVLLPRLRKHPAALKRVVRLDRRIVLPSHMLLGLAAFGAGAYHGFTAEGANVLLWAGLAMMGLLVVGGALLRWKWVPGKVRKAAYLLHAQNAMLGLLVALLLLGHLGVDD